MRHHRDSDVAALEAVQREFDARVAEGDLSRVNRLNGEFHSVCYNGHYNEEALVTAQRHTDLIGAIVERYPRSRARSLAVSREHWGIILRCPRRTRNSPHGS